MGPVAGSAGCGHRGFLQLPLFLVGDLSNSGAFDLRLMGEWEGTVSDFS